MYRKGPEVHLDAQEARAGRRGPFMFKVLAMSMVLIIAAMAVIWLTGAQTTPSAPDPAATASAGLAL